MSTTRPNPPITAERLDELTKLQMKAKSLWKECLQEQAVHGVSILMPTMEVRVDDFAHLLAFYRAHLDEPGGWRDIASALEGIDKAAEECPVMSSRKQLEECPKCGARQHQNCGPTIAALGTLEIAVRKAFPDHATREGEVEDISICIACDRPLKEGDAYYPDTSGGGVNVACVGPTPTAGWQELFDAARGLRFDAYPAHGSGFVTKVSGDLERFINAVGALERASPPPAPEGEG